MRRTAVLMALLFAPLVPAVAQNAATTEALIAEVRQLRAALERTMSIMPRMQIMMWRAGAQEQRVTRLNERLANVQRQISQTQAESSNLANAAKEQEDRMAAEQDPTRRRMFEEGVRGMKFGLQRTAEREQQLRAEEAEIAGGLRREQAALDELLRRLDDLERSLPAR